MLIKDCVQPTKTYKLIDRYSQGHSTLAEEDSALIKEEQWKIEYFNIEWRSGLYVLQLSRIEWL